MILFLIFLQKVDETITISNYSNDNDKLFISTLQDKLSK